MSFSSVLILHDLNLSDISMISFPTVGNNPYLLVKDHLIGSW